MFRSFPDPLPDREAPSTNHHALGDFLKQLCWEAVRQYPQSLGETRNGPVVRASPTVAPPSQLRAQEAAVQMWLIQVESQLSVKRRLKGNLFVPYGSPCLALQSDLLRPERCVRGVRPGGLGQGGLRGRLWAAGPGALSQALMQPNASSSLFPSPPSKQNPP